MIYFPFFLVILFLRGQGGIIGKLCWSLWACSSYGSLLCSCLGWSHASSPSPCSCFKLTYIRFLGFRPTCTNTFVHKHLCNILTNVTCPSDNLQLKHASPTGCSISPRLHQTAVLLCSGVLVIYPVAEFDGSTSLFSNSTSIFTYP